MTPATLLKEALKNKNVKFIGYGYYAHSLVTVYISDTNYLCCQSEQTVNHKYMKGSLGKTFRGDTLIQTLKLSMSARTDIKKAITDIYPKHKMEWLA